MTSGTLTLTGGTPQVFGWDTSSATAVLLPVANPNGYGGTLELGSLTPCKLSPEAV